MNPVAIAVPFFFALILGEVWLARRRGRVYHRFNAVLADLGCGVTDQVLSVFFAVGVVGSYTWLYDGFRVWDPPAALAWICAIVGVDFSFYWWHRLSHRVNAMWAIHVVHHQSDDYNLAVALRQDALGALSATVFYLPWALLGVPPVALFTGRAINLLYQFWVHTRTVGKLGWLDGVLSTPSAHRVHHGADPRCLDRNYGGILLVWDRLFGTWQAELDEPVYGSVARYDTWNPLWANALPWVRLWAAARAVPTWRGRVAFLFAPPERLPDGSTARLPSAAELAARPPYDADGSPGLHRYAVFQFIPVAAGTVAMLVLGESGRWGLLAGLAVAILWALAASAALFERRRWAFAMEGVRIGVTTITGIAAGAPIPAIAWGMASAIWLRRLSIHG